jgi:hypothetical protein
VILLFQRTLKSTLFQRQMTWNSKAKTRSQIHHFFIRENIWMATMALDSKTFSLISLAVPGHDGSPPTAAW